MAATITAQFDSRDVRVLLSALAPRQWAFTTAVALTRTGKHVKDAERDAMSRSFDRPTPFTLNGLFLQGATPSDQQARVWFKDFAPKGTPAAKYLMPEVHGGLRSDKRLERSLQRAGYLSAGRQLTPASGASRDQYGNVPRGIYTQILSQLHASADATQFQSARSRRTRARRAGSTQFFYGNPGGKGRGVWMRTTGGRVLGGRTRGSITPIFLEQRPHAYRPRFAFFTIAEKVAAAHYQAEFAAAAEQTLTARSGKDEHLAPSWKDWSPSEAGPCAPPHPVA